MYVKCLGQGLAYRKQPNLASDQSGSSPPLLLCVPQLRYPSLCMHLLPTAHLVKTDLVTRSCVLGFPSHSIAGLLVPGEPGTLSIPACVPYSATSGLGFLTSTAVCLLLIKLFS